MKPFKVLFVCTANICRTPIAKYYLLDKLRSNGLDGLIEVLSAGTWAQEGHPAAENSVLVCRENGIDASGHVATNLTTGIVNEADIILCMSERHKKDLSSVFPHSVDKIFLLTEYPHRSLNSSRSIPDPFGRKLTFYRDVFEQIRAEIDRFFPALIAEAKKNANVA
jgi:protein-tyrosine-phosphatase